MYINVQSDIRTLQQAACRAQGREWTPNIRHCWRKWPTKYRERIFGVPQSLLMPPGQMLLLQLQCCPPFTTSELHKCLKHRNWESVYSCTLLLGSCVLWFSGRILCYSNTNPTVSSRVCRSAEAPCTIPCTRLYASKVRKGFHKKAYSKILQDWV